MESATNAFGLLAFPDACRKLKLTPRTARYLMNHSDFPRPSIKLGRTRFYRSEDELTAWLDRQAKKAAQPQPKRRRTRAAA